jgi:DNA-directed RNA polymerase subunit RPC12/RpoP
MGKQSRKHRKEGQESNKPEVDGKQRYTLPDAKILIVCMYCGEQIEVDENAPWDKIHCRNCQKIGYWRFE